MKNLRKTVNVQKNCLLIGLGHFIGVNASVINAFHFKITQLI
jgi:hypothetical protein